MSQANIARQNAEAGTVTEVCTIDDLGIELTGEDAPPLIETLNEYFSLFAKPVRQDKPGDMLFGNLNCFKCGEALNGMLGTFQWGMRSGEGTCSKCGWPCRAHHLPKDDDGAIFDRCLEIILQYHPDHVETKDAYLSD